MAVFVNTEVTTDDSNFNLVITNGRQYCDTLKLSPPDATDPLPHWVTDTAAPPLPDQLTVTTYS